MSTTYGHVDDTSTGTISHGVIEESREGSVQDIPLEDEPPIVLEPTTPPPQSISTRQQWGSRLSFLFASIGAAIGFGNFFRFPYLVFSSGGGAFLM